MAYRIAMIGAGSVGFSLAVARELIDSETLGDSTFALMDLDAGRLSESGSRIRQLAEHRKSPLKVVETLDRREALTGAEFVVTSFAPKRIEYWMQDMAIAERHGVELLQGENGGPTGQIHALRNITILAGIVKDMEELCPDAWLMNFTNPMSMLCTYLRRYARVPWLGFCHQVHGSIGVAAEMLGMEPGELEVVTAGINHMNFLLDIRRKGQTGSYMEEFFDAVRENTYWQKLHENVPEQRFTLELLDAFGVYPVGYDNHIIEYMGFFHTPEEWKEIGYTSSLTTLKRLREVHRKTTAKGTIDDVEIERMLGEGVFPFPKDPAVDYYKEAPVGVMESLITNTPLYLDAMVTVNNGCIANLPAEAVVDIPAVITGGQAHGLAVGELPAFPAELCRRQIAIHELVAQAAFEGDRRLFLEALCLDPYVHHLSTARAIMEDYLETYREYVPQFF